MSGAAGSIDTSPWPYPGWPSQAKIRAALSHMRSGKLATHSFDLGGLDFARWVIGSSGSIPATLPKGSIGGPLLDERGKAIRSGGGAPAPCSVRLFQLDAEQGSASRVNVGCAVWEGVEPAFDWALWRSDQLEGLPGIGSFLRGGDWEDAEMLAERVMAAALPHPTAQERFRSADGLDRLGKPLPAAIADFQRRVKSGVEAAEIAGAAGPGVDGGAHGGAGPRL